MTIDEFLAGMAEHHPMIQRRALDVHFLNGGQLEARVKYIKWSSDGYKSARTLVTETHLEADIVEKALKVLLENNEIAIENPNNSVNKLYYLKPKTKWRQKKL